MFFLGHECEQDGHERRSGKTRWNMGKTYTQVKSDDPTVQSAYRQRPFPSLLQSRYASEYTDGKMRHGQHLIKSSHYTDDPHRSGQETTPYRDDPRTEPTYHDDLNYRRVPVYRDNPNSGASRNCRDCNVQTDFPTTYRDDTETSHYTDRAYSRPKERSRSESDVPHSIHENGESSDGGSAGEDDMAPNAYIRPHGEGGNVFFIGAKVVILNFVR